MRVDARISQGTPLGGAAGNAFAHLGSYQSSASLVLSAPSGQLSLGNTGTSFSDLTGLYPYGQGALLHLQHPEWSLLGLGALSMSTVGYPDRKPMVGLRGERQLGVAQISASVSHLADAGTSPRKLDAVGIGRMFQQPTQAVRDRLGEREAEGSGLALDVVGGAKHLIA